MSKRIHKCSRQSLCLGWTLLVHADEGGESQDQVSAGQRDVCTSCAPIGCSVGRCGQETRESLISCDCTFTLPHPPFVNLQSAWYGASKRDCKSCNYCTTVADLSCFLDRLPLSEKLLFIYLSYSRPWSRGIENKTTHHTTTPQCKKSTSKSSAFKTLKVKRYYQLNLLKTSKVNGLILRLYYIWLLILMHQCLRYFSSQPRS